MLKCRIWRGSFKSVLVPYCEKPLKNWFTVGKPFAKAKAVRIGDFRMHAIWALLQLPPKSGGRRVLFDTRLALTLRSHGVSELATRNLSHFSNFGFTRVWNPVD